MHHQEVTELHAEYNDNNNIVLPHLPHHSQSHCF
jgi:hypothetical protein